MISRFVMPGTHLFSDQNRRRIGKTAEEGDNQSLKRPKHGNGGDGLFTLVA